MTRFWLGLVVAVAGCAAPSTAPADTGLGGVGPHVRFDLQAGPLPFGSIPFPDDLYRDAAGLIQVDPAHGLGSDPLTTEMLRDAADLSGFSAIAPAFFYLDGPIDPATLPANPHASMSSDASVFLLDIDISSPEAFSRVPVECEWSLAENRLTVRPARGEPLTGGRRYAVVVTSRVRDADGNALQPNDMYRQVLEAESVPREPLLAAAYQAHVNALSALENVALPRSQIAGLAVFKVQDPVAALEAVIAQSEAFPVAPLTVDQAASSGALMDTLLGVPTVVAQGVDGLGGVAHDNIGWVIQGSLDVPSFLSSVATEIGTFETDTAGQLMTKRVESLPFTLCLPVLAPTDVGAVLPLVLFQHGLGRDRSDVLPLANELNAAGYAVLAIEAPYHGLRRPNAVDLVHRFGNQTMPDRFADVGGEDSVAWFLGDSVVTGSHAPFHPAYLRDAVRQNVSDWIVALRTLTAAPLPSIAGMPEVSFAVDRIGFVGIDMGGQVGLMLSSVDPRLDAGLLAMTGGGLAEWLITSPALTRCRQGLFEQLGVDDATVNPFSEPPLVWPALALWQTLVDPADPLAFAPTLRRKSRDFLMVMVRDDEYVANRATEALAGALRLPIADTGTARFVELQQVSLPAVDNVLIEGEFSTQVLFEQVEAAHTMYSSGHDTRNFESTSVWPFLMRAEPLVIDNPIEPALTQAVFFFESWREGSATVIDSLAQARVPAR